MKNYPWYSADKKLVSIIVVHWGEYELLEKCVKSIESQTYRSLELIIINNSSYPVNFKLNLSMRVINNEKNNFYSKSVNQGISVSKGEFILVLNNDVVLDRNFLEQGIKSFDYDEDIGMVGGKILKLDEKKIDSTGQFLSKFLTPVERGYNEIDKGQYDKKGYVFGICAAAVVYRRKMLEDIKINSEYFDEDFVMFYEDLDLNWRAYNMGWRAFYNPKALAYHERGGSSLKKSKDKKKFYFTQLPVDLKGHVVKNRYMTIIKNAGLNKILVNLLWVIIFDCKLWLYLVLNQPNLIIKILKVFNSYLPNAFKKRKYNSAKF